MRVPKNLILHPPANKPRQGQVLAHSSVNPPSAPLTLTSLKQGYSPRFIQPIFLSHSSITAQNVSNHNNAIQELNDHVGRMDYNYHYYY